MAVPRDRPARAALSVGSRSSPGALRAPGDEVVTHLEAAEGQVTALMCAEIVPQRCHRLYLADAATARGWSVVHIIDRNRVQPHVLSPLAAVEGGRVA